MGRMHEILIFSQLQLTHFLLLFLSLLLQPPLSFHCSHTTHFLIRFYSRFLKPLNRFFQFLPDSRVFSRQFDDSSESILGSDPQFAQFIVEIVQFGVIGNVCAGNFNLVFFVLVVERNQTTILSFLLHLLEDFNQILELFLQLLSGTTDQRWQFFCFFHPSLGGRRQTRSAFGNWVDFLLLNFITNPLSSHFGIDLLLLLVKNGDDLLLRICQIFIALIGGVEIELTHLVRPQWDLYLIDDFNQFIHAQQILSGLAFMQGNQEQIMHVFHFVLACPVTLPLEDRHQFPQLLRCQSLHQQNYHKTTYKHEPTLTSHILYWRVQFNFFQIDSDTQLAGLWPMAVYYICNLNAGQSQPELPRLVPFHRQKYTLLHTAFMLEMHQRVNEEYEVPSTDPHIIAVIDQASVKLKTYKEQINILEQQLKESEMARVNTKDIRNEQVHLEKRLAQKCDQISILRETVKTLYQDNERLSIEKEAACKEVAVLREGASSLKKRLKKQEEDIFNHKNELKKLTATTEERIAEYLRQDEHKQLTLKKLTQDLDRLKAESTRKDKALATSNKKLDQLKNVQTEHDKAIRLVETLKQENSLAMRELQMVEDKFLEEKARLLREADALRRTSEELREKSDMVLADKKDLQGKLAYAQQKNMSYETEILMRTEKLKEKNKQVKVYSEEINKLAKRVEELSEISDEVVTQNQQLSDQCRQLQTQLEQVRTFQEYIGKIKGDLNHKKSQQLGKLLESLGKLQSHA